MISTREAALTALVEVVKTALPDAQVVRESDETQAPAPGGTIHLRDGEGGEPEVYLGQPVAYGFEHEATLVLVVGQAQPGARDRALDLLIAAVGDALEDSPSLGGVVEWCELGVPQIQTLPVNGGLAMKAAEIPIVFSYVTDKRTG